jgi:hypothetical protein
MSRLINLRVIFETPYVICWTSQLRLFHGKPRPSRVSEEVDLAS